MASPKTRSFRNPVRSQFALIGTSLFLLGIRSDKKGNVRIVSEATGVVMPISNPSELLWITRRAVSGALEHSTTPVIFGEVPLGLVQAKLKEDGQAVFRKTEDHIVHMFARELREDPEVLAFAKAQVAGLEKTYAKAVAAAA